MSLFVNLRGSNWGAVVDPYVLEGDPLSADPPMLAARQWPKLDLAFAGKDVLLATHGFNVSYASGVRSLGRLDAALALPAPGLCVGVLWPGDFAVPAINYPFAVGVAREAGRRLGAFCNRWLAKARSVSLVSHSLGARVVLECAAVMDQRPKVVCVTAGAVNDDCLVTEYLKAALAAQDLQTLSARTDKVLALAYPPGDLIAEILHDDHTPFTRALGREGPTLPWAVNVRGWEIPDGVGPDRGFDHGDYLPSGAFVPDPSPTNPPRWSEAAAFIRRAVSGGQQSWS